MSNKNIEKKKLVTNKGEKVGKRTQNKSPFKKDKISASLNMNINDLNITFPNREITFLENTNNNFIYDIKEEREKKIPSMNKNDYLSKLNNNMNNYGFSDSSYMFPINNRDLSILTDTNILDKHSSNTNITQSSNKNKVLKNLSMQNMKSKNLGDNTKIKNMILKNNIDNSLMSNNSTNSMINSNNLSYQSEPYDSKYSIKINKIKDDYIDFLQKEFEDNTKKSVKLDSNNKELLKKCDDLIHDNRILSNTLNDRTSKLNKIIQENLMIKTELDKSLLTNQKNEQKLEYYEEQFKLFKSSNENYQKIINELKDQNDKLNTNLIEMQKENEKNLIAEEEKYKMQLKEELDNLKKEMEEVNESKMQEENEKFEKKEQSLMQQLKELQDKNEELLNEITNKDNMFDLVCKENEKLTNENNLFRSQVDQYSHQITELNTIIKHKDNIINNLKAENLNNEKFLNKSSSCSMMKFDGSEYINENISKLITDNEENKMKIELLNDKLKSIDEIERKYNEIMNGARTISLSEKLAYHMNSNSKSPEISTHFNYNSLNNIKNSTYQKNSGNKLYNTSNSNYKTFLSPKKLQLHIGQLNEMMNSPDVSRNKYEKTDLSMNLQDKDNKQKTRSNGNNVIVYSSNISRDNKRKKINNNIISNNTEKKDKNRNTIDREIKITKKPTKVPEKENKNISKTRKVEIITSTKKRSNKVEENKSNKVIEEKETKIIHGKELETEKDEVKESIREMNRKKNYTHKPKIINYSLEEIEIDQKKAEDILSIGSSKLDKVEEEIKEKQNNLYLYGIDRNDMLHTFEVNNKRWFEMRKITDLEDKSDTFKKDYQYEGTLLYNTLYGVYILTGEKTDILYYFDSHTECITKICKFNNSHDNGSMMYDTNNNCLYVFGGKKITSCEYYSFKDKKVYKLPDLITDRANASFIISNNKIFGFFGFSYSKNNYARTIEYMDYYKKDRWIELKNIEFLKEDISFDIESVSTMYFRQNQNQILIYCGIQGEEEDFVTDYYLLYDAQNNTMDKINQWNMQQYKSMGKRWKTYNFKKNDPKGFHFAKNTRFLLLPKDNYYEGYNERDPIDIMIDYKNNVHYILQEKQKIDVYRSDM